MRKAIGGKNGVPWIENLRKSFGPLAVVQNFELSVQRGEFVSFLGPSGCGKTTTLRMVAGVEVPTSGTIRINDKDVTRRWKRFPRPFPTIPRSSSDPRTAAHHETRTRMSLHVLAYNLKRVIVILGVAPLMEAMRAWAHRRAGYLEWVDPTFDEIVHTGKHGYGEIGRCAAVGNLPRCRSFRAGEEARPVPGRAGDGAGDGGKTGIGLVARLSELSHAALCADANYEKAALKVASFIEEIDL